MGKRMDLLQFPGGRRKALTLSYDDGVLQDRRLVKLMNQYGIKGTFNLGAGVLGFRGSAELSGRQVDISKLTPEEVPALYRGHEIAGHGLWHSALDKIGPPAAMYEIIEDKRRLEALTGTLLTSFAYPFGAYDETVKELLHLAGYRAARTVRSTGCFELPEDFLAWDPTCHHNDPALFELAERFLTDQAPFPKLFYLWGHAYEFDEKDNWDVIEAFCRRLSGKDEIWYCTNGQLESYVSAWRRLRYSADGSLLFNPSAQTLWLGVRERSYKIRPGETVRIDDPGL